MRHCPLSLGREKPGLGVRGGVLALETMYNLTPFWSGCNRWVLLAGSLSPGREDTGMQGESAKVGLNQEVPPLPGPGGLWEL